MAKKNVSAKTWSLSASYDGKRYSAWPAGDKPQPAGGPVSTAFDSLYTAGWAPNSGTNALAVPTISKPAKSTSILTGGYRDQRFDTEIRRITQISDQVNSTDKFMRHEYSKRQAFNADNTLRFVQGAAGWWFLYDAATNAVIPQGVTSGTGQGGIQGMAGDCEPIWHPTDPNKWWHTDNYGSLTWYERTYVGPNQAPTQTVLFNLSSKLTALGAPWNTGTKAWFNGEGVPSYDGRWWGLSVETSAFGSIGGIMYDRQTDTITGAVLTGGRKPNWIGTSPLGNYLIFSYYGTAQSSIAAEQALGFSGANGVWAFNRDGSFARVLSVLGEHSDFAVDALGKEYYVSISFRGAADHGGADGVWWLRIDTGAAGVIPNVEPYTGGAGFHFSGLCSGKRPGWVVGSKYGAADGGAYGGTVFAFEVGKVTPRVYRLAHSQWGESTTIVNTDVRAYYSEPHVTVNTDLTRVIYASSFRGGDVEDYQICLPSWAIPQD